MAWTRIEAYDFHFDEMVLLIPWIVAMLGDNPMQSEFASHIGLSGKCFCRVCHVRGADAKNRSTGAEGDRERVTDFLSVSIYFSRCWDMSTDQSCSQPLHVPRMIH